MISGFKVGDIVRTPSGARGRVIRISNKNLCATVTMLRAGTTRIYRQAALRKDAS